MVEFCDAYLNIITLNIIKGYSWYFVLSVFLGCFLEADLFLFYNPAHIFFYRFIWGHIDYF
jgi:hypothetical protein